MASYTPPSTSGKKSTVKNATADDLISKKYQKKTQREHIYDLPDTYVGGAEPVLDTMYLFNNDKNNMEFQKIEYVPALYKIMDELIVNTWDQLIRINKELEKNPKAKKSQVRNIKISINQETTEISVFNDGDGIDIAMHPKHNVYTVELIFGHLLTSTNYNNSEEKLTGGKNGYGAKLANVFSHSFEVETVDRNTRQKYIQKFENNMQVINPPKITKCSSKPYTKITLIPDLERFGMKKWTPEMVQIIQKRAYDLSACCGLQVDVQFNDKSITCKNFDKFMNLFEEPNKNGKYFEIINERWEVGVSISDDGFKQVSFVNGVCTIKGGKHVDYITNQISKKICEYIKKKEKITVKTAHVKENLMIFVKSLIVNPSFDGQTKETLTTPSTKFGSKCEINDKFITQLVKLGLVERVMKLHQFKEDVKSKKDTKNRGRISGIPKLDDANNAGGNKSSQCTLILTEGDSAKAMAIAGLSVIGRDNYGVFPLRGKLINAREKMTTAKGKAQLSNNEELSNLKKILGLEIGKKYTNETIQSDLRYGKVMIMTDQDVDGSHIKGLFMNWVDAQWPELLKLNFVTSMLTPIIKAKKKKQEIAFYSIGQYLDWKATNPLGWSIKYYKGLGTSTTNEAKEYFRALRQVHYFTDEESPEALDMAFAKERTDDRKLWLTDYDISATVDVEREKVSYSEFVNLELKHFSIYDLQRSIGHISDGLKPSQRKILYGCFKRKLYKEIKVAQLAGYVSEHTGYHHGEESLNKAIIGMAQQFVGSNNLNLLEPNGQFGTRLQGGKDAASPRYIFTLLSPLTSKLFPQDDMPLLEYLDDDGMKVEPRYFVPILPIALLNGVHGVGTGYSTMIPMYSPNNICDAFIKKLRDGKEFTPLMPHYNGFGGKIIELTPQSYLTKGIYEITDFKTITVKELPIGVWTDDYKEFLETLLVDYKPPNAKGKKLDTPNKGYLKHYKSHCTESSVDFVLEFKPDVLKSWIQHGTDNPHIDYFEKQLHLTSKVSLTNMHLFNVDSVIQKYTSIVEIMNDFFDVRYQFYIKRKEYQLEQYRHELNILQSKIRFIEDIINDKIVVYKKTKTELTEILETMEYPKFIMDSSNNASYNYLLNMPIYSLTVDNLENLKKQEEDKQLALTTLDETTIEKLWLKDLESFKSEYRQYMLALQKELKEANKDSLTSSKKKKSKKTALKKK